MNHGVEFKNITKRYGADASAPLAVKGISFEIKKGSLTTIRVWSRPRAARSSWTAKT
jgi:ABC-type dipeptide/oligopeptide/nickel transport system ATPase subunit